MVEIQAVLDKILDTFFHLPTLITMALIGIVMVWSLYNIGLEVGDGFIRFNSNVGNINLYWINGCCNLDW